MMTRNLILGTIAITTFLALGSPSVAAAADSGNWSSKGYSADGGNGLFFDDDEFQICDGGVDRCERGCFVHSGDSYLIYRWCISRCESTHCTTGKPITFERPDGSILLRLYEEQSVDENPRIDGQFAR